VRPGLGLACFLAFCNHPSPVAEVTLPPSASSHAPTPAASTTAVAAQHGPFSFVRGKPQEMLGDYATRYWGPNGASVFTSAASRRVGDVAGGPADEVLIDVGQYAVVEVPDRVGFFVRDFGERGWVTGLEAQDMTGGAKKEVVLRYTIRDEEERAKEDWARWQKKASKVPEVNAMAHMVLEVWSFAGPEPALLFVHEHEAWALCCGSEIGPAPPRVSDDIALKPGEITIRVRDAWRASAASFKETPLPDVPPVLAPWGGVKERTFRFDPARRVFSE